MEAKLREDSARNESPEMTGQYSTVPLWQVHTGNLNPRTVFDHEYIAELASSIQQRGLMEPIVVRRFAENRWFINPGRESGKDGFFLHDTHFLDASKPQFEQYDSAGPLIFYATREEAEEKIPLYEIIAGECRWRACNAAGVETIDVKLVECESDKAAKELALIENLTRRDIDVVDEARALKELVDMGHTVTELGQTVNRAQSTISNLIRLVEQLPAEVLELIRAGKITQSHGKALLTWIDFPEVFAYLLEQATKGATTKSLEKLGENYGLISKKIIARYAAYDFADHRTPECCSDCESRRKETGYDDFCLDPKCYNKLVKDSKKAEVDAARQKAMREYPGVVTESTKLAADIKGDWQWITLGNWGCKAECAHMETVIRPSGEPGQICRDTECYKLKQSEQEAIRIAEIDKTVQEHRQAFLDLAESGKHEDRENLFSRIIATELVREIDCTDLEACRLAAIRYGLDGLNWEFICSSSWKDYINAMKFHILAAQDYRKLLLFKADLLQHKALFSKYSLRLEVSYRILGSKCVANCPTCKKQFELSPDTTVVCDEVLYCSAECKEASRKQEEPAAAKECTGMCSTCADECCDHGMQIDVEEDESEEE